MATNASSAYGRIKILATAWLIVGVLGWQVCALAQEGSSSQVSASYLATLVKRFGPEAAVRIADWQTMLQALKQARAASTQPQEQETLNAVNRYFNNAMTFVDDLSHWGIDDYWATPAEFIASGGGDCEDYVLAKYYALKELGIPATQLRIVYVRSTRIKQPHMVLAYYATPHADPLVLDNLDAKVLPGSQRPDLTPVYSFNDDELWLVRSGVAAPSGRSTQVRVWRELQDRLRREQSQ